MNTANWIWKSNENAANTWMCFVKDVFCDHKPQKAAIKIAVDSKYWLYINGKMAVFEGGLKRALPLGFTYYDELDLSGRFREGKNRIAILVCYFGKSGFSHLSSRCGGLFFEAAIDETMILSDASWKVKKNTAYIAAPEDDIGPNFRLPESDIYYDASLELGEWYERDYPVDRWDNADVLSAEEVKELGTFVERGIPQFKREEIRDFVNSDSVRGLTVEKNTTLEMRLPYNMQFTPYLVLDAPAGKQITIRTENYYTNAPGENCIKSVYITKEGFQEYEALGWLNGERIQFEIPAGVTVISLRYRQTGYHTERIGQFHCDDAFLNRLWKKCYRTLHITMRDSFMDCPDRERTQWWGDVNIEMQMLLYCMDERAKMLYEKGVDSLIRWYEATGMMLTVVPPGKMQFELPFQNLAGIYGFFIYYQHTGNADFIRKIYPMASNYVLGYEIGEDGLVVHREGSWDWPDWGEHADIAIMENAWYCLALDSCSRMAEVLGKDAIDYKARLEIVRKSMLRKINNDGVFYDKTDNGEPDDRANALAVLAGLSDDRNNEALTRLFAQTENASPYMEKYVLDALCKMGRIDEAVARIRKRYTPMVEDEYSTLWELWNKEASLNHAWTGGPLITMAKYIAGISPVGEKGLTYRVCPHLGSLRYVDCTVPTRRGPLSVQITAGNGRYYIFVEHPKEVKVIVQTPEDSNCKEAIKVWNT